MTVSTIYREFLIEDIIKESLKEGDVLTKDEIDAELEERTESNPDLSEPFTQEELYNIDFEEESSAKKMNDIMLTVHNDLSVVYRSLTEQASDVNATYDAVTSELKSIEKRVRGLEDKSKSLLLISKNVEGYLDHISDDFSNKDKVDIAQSDVLVDNTAGYVTLSPLAHTRIPLKLEDSDLQFNVISREQLQSVTLAPESNILDAFTDQDNIWLQRVSMQRSTGSVTSELILRMPTTTAEVSKIIYKPAVSDEGNISTVTVQYSDDGLNWRNTDGDGTARLIGDVTLIFSPVQAAFWKFVFNKAGYDEFIGDSYVYEFGARSIQLYGVEYKQIDNQLQGTLISKPQSSEKESEFNRVSLKVCESLPTGTNIDYFLAGLTQTDLDDYNAGTIDLDDLNFNAIDPVEREETTNPLVIDFAKLSTLNGISSSFDTDALLTFRYQNDFNVLIDYLVDPTAVREELKVLRNTGDNTADGGSNTPVKVKFIDNGWSFNGTNYLSEFYVLEDSGKVIDFGPNSLIIDGLKTNGQVTLSKGFHRISTHKDNWRGVAPQDIVAPGNTPDILYPYNHKYLIEGIGDTLYGVDMTTDVGGGTLRSEVLDPDGLYTGAERYFETTMEEVTIFDFVSNIADDNYNVYSFLKDSVGDDRIMIKTSPEPGLLTNENLAIITRTVSSDLHKAIILKAVFNSEESKTTPALDEYIVRLGF